METLHIVLNHIEPIRVTLAMMPAETRMMPAITFWSVVLIASGAFFALIKQKSNGTE
jgi:hypothetical protein